MSVINQALLDLDKQAPAAAQPALGMADSGLPAAQAPRRSSARLGVLLFIAAFAGVAGAVDRFGAVGPLAPLADALSWLRPAAAPMAGTETAPTSSKTASQAPAAGDNAEVAVAALPQQGHVQKPVPVAATAQTALPLKASTPSAGLPAPANPAAPAMADSTWPSRSTAPARPVHQLAAAASPEFLRSAVTAPQLGMAATMPAAMPPSTSVQPALAVPVPMPARVDRRASSAPAAAAPVMLWNKAVEQVNVGQRQAALSTLQELLKTDPHQEQARHLAAVLLHEGGHTDQAMSILSDGLALGGRQVSLALLLARLQAALGLGDAALASLQQSRVEGPEADGLRAGILAQRGNYHDAVPAYQSALRRQPANALWWAGLGVALESDGQAEQAKVAYLQARNLGIAREELASYVDQRIRALD